MSKAASQFRWPWQKKKGRSVRQPEREVAPAPSQATVANAIVQPPTMGLPKFQTTATDHLDKGHRDPRVRGRVRLRNAFMPAQPVSDPLLFAGRRDLLTNVIRSVEDQRSHVVIYGPRGMGKTSLVRMMDKAAEDARYIVVYFSCGASSDFNETFRTSALEIPLFYHSSVSPSSSETEAGSSLVDLLGPGRLTPRMFADAAAKLVGTRVLIVLDEFDRTESPEFRRDVAELIKTLSDVSARVQLVIVGVASDLADLIEHIPSIRRSIAAIRVGAMSDEEVLLLVENGAKASGIEFPPKPVELITSASRGSPYIANLLCHFAGMYALDAGRMRVEVADVDQALEHAIEEFRGRLPNDLLTQLDEADRGGKLPASIEDDEKRATGAARLANSVDTPAKLLERLKGDGAIQDGRSTAYDILVDSLAPYLQLKHTRESLLNEAA